MNIKATIIKYKQLLLHKLKQAFRYFGYFLIYTGETIIGVRSPYRLISYIIEHTLRSKDIVVHVVHAYEKPLFVRFQLKVSLPKPFNIDGDYFKRELSAQIGCHLSDINTDIENDTYYVEITKTAICNLEKGCTPFMPQAYKEDSYDDLIDDAKELVRQYSDISASLLQKRLKIGYARACRIMDELEELGLIAQAQGSKPRKVVN